MSHIAFGVNITTKRCQGPLMTVCGVEGCNQPIPLSDAFRLRVPVGGGMMSFDNRPKTRTGGRLGASSNGRRPFTKTMVVNGCVSCSLRFPNLRPEPKPYKTWKVR